MNLRYLEILEAVARSGSFTGAARELFITQSAVSHAVAELEAQAGTALFQRLPKGVRLTACGRVLLEESKGLLIACRNLDRRIGHLEEETPLHIVSSITVASFLLPQILARFRRAHPQLSVFVKIASADAVLAVLQHGDADLAFWEGTAPCGEFSILPLDTYQLKAACAPDFEVGEQPLSLRQLCEHPLLLRERGSAIRDTLDHLLATENIHVEPLWESVNSLALEKAAEAGLGITVLPCILLEEAVSAHRLRFVPLQTARLENQIFALYHREQYVTKPLQLLLRTLQEVGPVLGLRPEV